MDRNHVVLGEAKSRRMQLAEALDLAAISRHAVVRVMEAARAALAAQRLTETERREGEAILNDFEGVVRARGFELASAMADKLSQFYTPEEVDALIGFYSTETGKGIIKKQMTIADANFAIGAEWGQRVAEDFDLQGRMDKLGA